jgi:hypothetical protein
MREWALTPRESERCTRGISRAAPGDTRGRQRVGEGDERLRWLFVADEFARQSRGGRLDNFAWVHRNARAEISVQEVRREDSGRLVEVEVPVAGDELDLLAIWTFGQVSA